MRPLPFVYLCLLYLLSFQTVSHSQTFTLLKNINPDPSGIDDFFPVNVNGTLFFLGNDNVHGLELWKTDGTTAGTAMVKDINPGSDNGVVGSLVNVNGIVFFAASDGSHGFELWKSDGTDAGTVMVKDIRTGLNRSSCAIGLQTAINVSGTLYFSADDGVAGRELWKSDGTDAGTVLVKDINPGINPSGINAGKPRIGDPSNFKYVNGVVLFTAITDATGQELWRSDGTDAGTYMVKDIYPGTFGSSIRNAIVVNNALYFTIHGTNYELYKSDGTNAGTVSLRIMNPIGMADTWPCALGGILYFLDEDGLYRSDGSNIGTFKIKDASQTPNNLISTSNSLYFIGSDVSTGTELWKSDGTSTGTSIVKDINPGSDGSVYSGLAKVGNKLIFSVSDGFHGYELWKSDGTENGTAVLQTTDPDNAQEFQIVEAGGNAYAVINTTTFGKELWVASVNAPILLPLTFLEFKGTIINDDGQLQWKTDHETQTSAFIVERSVDGSNYKSIGYVNAANVAGVNSYGFKDATVSSLGVKRIYYRLKEVDINGKFIYSRIVALSIDDKANFVMIYPNPVQRDINLTLTLAQKTKLNWQLVDGGGRVIKNGIYEVYAGSTSVSIEANTLRAGTYYLQLKGEGLQQVIKVLKQ